MAFPFGLDRLLARVGLVPARRSYDGGAGGRRWRGGGTMPNQNTAALAARGTMASRARYLVANNAMAAAGVEAWVSSLIGTGIRPTSTHPDASWRAAAARAWDAWTDRADADGLVDGYGIQALMVRRMIVDGEAFAVVGLTDHGATVRVLDAEQVDATVTRELDGGARIVQGVELDATGRRVAYHVLRDRPGFGLRIDHVRVPAEDMVHLLRIDVPGQIRGVSWFAPILLRLRELDEAHDAQVVRQKLAAMLAGFIVSPDGQVPFDGEVAAGVLDGGMEPGTIKILRPGEDIRFSDPAKIGQEAIDFLKITAREIAAGLGVPASVLTGDYSDANYSSLRASIVEFRRRVEAIQHNVIVFQMLRPLWRRVLATEILAGRLSAIGFERDPEAYVGARWITPRQEWVDPMKDAQAEVLAIQNGLMSRRAAVEARGLAVEDLDEEIAADQARADALGLRLGSAPAPKEETAS
ncbi:phage portal protein [Prosthecomicrobium sp. N25]|uniref:phage portal protein n=1 Tax=Prosthecomicrobium sp. N25 TaxID=3129254 RepID=UPI0030775D1B